MTGDERSRDVYERIAGYPQPPLVPLPPPGDLSTLSQMGVVPGKGVNRFVSTVLGMTGYRAFERGLPDRIEGLLRKHNLRLPGVFAPVISATLLLADDPRALSPVERAATLVMACRSLYEDIFSGRLPADTYRGEPLEMGQYPNVFGTSLVVGERGVSVFKTTRQDQLQLMIRGRAYTLELRNQDGGLRVEDVVDALRGAVGRGESRPLTAGEAPVGLLTGALAPTQRAAFAALHRTPAGERSLERAKHTLFTVCFDLNSRPADDAEAALMAHMRQPENRWFHSSLQLVVFGNGKAAAICNFSTYLDGNTMIRVGAEIQRRGAACRLPPAGSSGALPPAEELAFETTPEVLKAVERARGERRRIEDGQRATFTIEGYGRKQLSGPGVDAVPAFITALEATARELVGRHAGVTQFFTMSRYRCMDMVTGDVTTPEVKTFVDALLAGKATRDEQRALLVRAAASQQEAARALRRCLSLTILINLFIREQKGMGKRIAIGSQAFVALSLKLAGRLRPPEREILVSHPEIYPEVPIVGRPGVRLPYVKYFGLHYQIWDDKIVITMMPSVSWQTPNAEFIKQLTRNLERICGLLQ